MRSLGVGLLSACVLAVGGCGDGERAIDTPTALAVFKQAGFRNLAVFSNKEALREAALRLSRPDLAADPLDSDFIYTRGFDNPIVMPLTAVRLPSSEAARQRVRNDQPLFEETLSAEERQLLPQGFDVARLTEVRVCNVVITSYNATGDPALDRRLKRAVSTLREKC